MGITHIHLFMLDYQDSNLDKQNQNLLCYHYTIGQSSCVSLLEKTVQNYCFFMKIPNIMECFCCCVNIFTAFILCDTKIRRVLFGNLDSFRFPYR